MVDIITRAGKGAPLLSSEMDANLVALKEGIEALVGITVVDWVQDPVTYALTLELSNGDFVGPLTLPERPWRLTGAWVAQDYIVGDVATFEGSAYYRNNAGASTDILDEVALGDWTLLVAGSAASPLLYTAFKAAPSNGLVVQFIAPRAFKLKAADPVVVHADTAAGGSNAWGALIGINGVTSVTVSATADTLVAAPVDRDIAPGDKISIGLAAAPGWGAVTNVSITLLLHPVVWRPPPASDERLRIGSRWTAAPVRVDLRSPALVHRCSR